MLRPASTTGGTIYEGRDYQFVGADRTSHNPSAHILPTSDGMFDEYWDNPTMTMTSQTVPTIVRRNS